MLLGNGLLRSTRAWCLFVSSMIVMNVGQVAGQFTPGSASVYSIVAWDSTTGDLGICVQSDLLSIGAVVPYAKSGMGAVASQGSANTMFGPRGLDLLAQGMGAGQVGGALLEIDPDSATRQLAIVDARGGSFSFTGSQCGQSRGSLLGRGYAVQGSMLTSEGVLTAVARTFEMAQGALGDRLLEAMQAGDRAGGQRHAPKSAALLVVRARGGFGGMNDRYVDIRVDSDPKPLFRLAEIYSEWESSFLIESQSRAIEEFARQRNFQASQEARRRVADILNKMLREKPDDPENLNTVALIMASNDIDKPQALEVAKRAAKLAPGRLDILSTLAECHFQVGHYDEAIAIASELVAKEPGNDGYWKQLQRFREARQR